MKKSLIISLMFVVGTSPVWAESVSYDKSDFAEISSVIDDAAFDIRYYSPNNFTGHRIDGYEAPRAYMTKELWRRSRLQPRICASRGIAC